MTDFSPLNTQIDATLKTMAEASTRITEHATALAAAVAAGADPAQVAMCVKRLKEGTDALAATLAKK